MKSQSLIIFTTIQYHQIKLMLCKYCSQKAEGINYRPNSSLDNVLTCSTHATALFIPFVKLNTDLHQEKVKTKLQILLQKLIDSIVAQFNLIKAEILQFETQMKKITEQNAINFRMNFELTNPYIVISADEQLLLSTFIKRIKLRYERQNVERQRNSLYNSRISSNEEALICASRKKTTKDSHYNFFTPQSTDRKRLDSNQVKKSIVNTSGSLFIDKTGIKKWDQIKKL